MRWIAPKGAIVIAVFLYLAFIALGTAVVSEAAARGALGINPLLGLRFGFMMASEAAWTAGHRAARVLLDLGAATLLLAGVFVSVSTFSEDVLGGVVFGALGMMIVFVALGAFIGNRAARRSFEEAE